MRIRCWGRTEAGRRGENQDAIAFTGVGVAEDAAAFSAEADSSGGVRMALLADGVGGSANGRWAARTALDELQRCAPPDATEASLATAVSAASRRLAERSRGPGSPATTLAGVAFDEARATVFHLGDSRVYAISAGETRQLTTDHRSLTDRRAISRYLGGSPAHAIPSFSTAALASGSRYLLTSDGVHAFVRLGALALVDLADPHATCAALIREAVAEGSDDNLSVVIVAVD